MKLTKKQVERVAKLANLKLSPREIKLYQQQLSEILAYIEKLKEINTTKIEPTSQVTGLTNVYREDKVKPSLSQKQALSNTKRNHKGYFVTQSVF